MKRLPFMLMVCIIAVLACVTASSQELVIFQDDTAMAVKSHSEKDGFVHLVLQEGKIAVPKYRVKEIRPLDRTNSPQKASAASTNLQLKAGKPTLDTNRPKGAIARNFGVRTGGVPARQPQADDDDENDDDNDLDDEDDDEGEAEEDDSDNDDDGTVNPPSPIDTPRTIPTKVNRPGMGVPQLRKR